MKKLFKTELSILIVFLLISFPHFIYSQAILINPATISGSTIGETDVSGNQISAIGIGEFVNNGDEPQSALDVRVPYLYPSSIPYDPAEVFHTTTEEYYGSFWRMFSGVHSNSYREKFHIKNYANSSHDIELNVLQEGGSMNFFTQDLHWMQLRSDGHLGLNNGVSNSVPWNNFSPQSILPMPGVVKSAVNEFDRSENASSRRLRPHNKQDGNQLNIALP
ncbi:MAG: hypothetical protein DWQ44_00740 [Bacteroidetes bacterium]|nr:MAG: hypothetical protein DWQ33_00210 [Bacteroidota bacterium]REK05049.1 MAG: hypothetical protein DWQ39_07515 [Bacteroidota bacterium]REK36450.1 MAG: hypothetical protein DWQ44_00740 [Bacteroidota bacterium]REK51664.1 MAG: hypothetical protein DWQ48_00490 [Bacteroidota bacterium]